MVAYSERFLVRLIGWRLAEFGLALDRRSRISSYAMARADRYGRDETSARLASCEKRFPVASVARLMKTSMENIG